MTPYYEQDGITIYHADNREILPALAPASVDLVLTSPPYNLGTTTGGGFPVARMGHYTDASGMRGRGALGAGKGKWANAARPGGIADGYGAHDDAMPHEEYVEWQKELLTTLWGLLTPRGAIYYNHKPRVLSGRVVTPLDYNPGLPVRQIVIWARAGGINFSTAFYCPTHEWLVILARDDFRLRDKGASGAGDVWRIPQEGGTEHPAPFPLALALTVMETTQGGAVLDPFAGSGTTLLAAKMHGREAIGIEREERWCEFAAKRLCQQVLPLARNEPKPEPMSLFESE